MKAVTRMLRMPLLHALDPTAAAIGAVATAPPVSKATVAAAMAAVSFRSRFSPSSRSSVLPPIGAVLPPASTARAFLTQPRWLSELMPNSRTTSVTIRPGERGCSGFTYKSMSARSSRQG
ncbi:hypothetical protein [Streptomyces sp. DH37]|uniref:hypothetical protein n=1 Tax=Streptomyces sp. DH37 TaxID=3040122 RepID=UPI002441FEF5|nr:hypothetical protein [Streptomyces sp. DH37]MDG9703315.1 hypothetical protein [Streptomyces sp. DH37]